LYFLPSGIIFFSESKSDYEALYKNNQNPSNSAGAGCRYSGGHACAGNKVFCRNCTIGSNPLIYCTLLNPAFDLLTTINSFVSGSTQRDVPSQLFPAGKGINVAHVVSVLGEDACVLGLMPERDRSRFVSYLETRGIGSHFYPIPGDVRINVTIAEQQDGAVTHVNCAGPALPPRIPEEFIPFANSHLVRGDQWCFSGSLPNGFDDNFYATMLKQCSDKGVDTFLDTRGKPLQLGVQARPLVIKPNSTELEELFDEQIKGVHHLALKGKKLLDRGVGYVFISLGSDGMIALHENDCLLCSPPPQVQTIDTVGCGDALMAGILVAWKRKFSFSETCRLAVACGSSKAMHAGPHTVSRDEIWQMMEEVKIKSV
jgi:1-phosphofructokinase family hexose kinase